MYKEDYRMTEPQEETSSQQDYESTKPVEEWSDEDLKKALTKVWEKYVEDWSTEDFPIVWEDNKRKQREIHLKLETLQSKEEFSLEEWIRLLAEVALDIYYVEKNIQFQTFVIRHHVGTLKRATSDIRHNLHIVNENILSIPSPPPPTYCQFDPFKLALLPDSPRLKRIEELLESISRRV